MTNRQQRPALVIMAKAPFPGEAKTRLAAVLGDSAAATLHQAFLLESVHRARLAAPASLAAVAPNEHHASRLRDVLPSDCAVHAQPRPGLMAGIAWAVDRALAGGAVSVAVIAADSPNLPLGHFDACFDALAAMQRGIVLGVCDDGGYYLVGAAGLDSAVTQDLFTGETYSSSTICQRTAARARSLSLSVSFGPSWYDVDTVAELVRLTADVKASPEPLPYLRDALAALVLPAG